MQRFYAFFANLFSTQVVFYLPAQTRKTMAKNLVIVESPAKAKTIEGYLGKDFVVKSSMGTSVTWPREMTASTSTMTSRLNTRSAPPPKRW